MASTPRKPISDGATTGESALYSGREGGLRVGPAYGQTKNVPVPEEAGGVRRQLQTCKRPVSRLTAPGPPFDGRVEWG